MRKIREENGLPVSAFIAIDDDGREWLIDYELFHEDAAESVRLGYASTIEEAEDEALLQATPDMEFVRGPAPDAD